MNRDAEKSARKDAGNAPAVVDLRDRVPQMTDDALVNLSKNALRLKDEGTALQKNAVADLLPVVEAEIARRRAEKLANAPPKAARGRKKAAAPVAAEPEPDEDDEA